MPELHLAKSKFSNGDRDTEDIVPGSMPTNSMRLKISYSISLQKDIGE